jgi:hypothetical protein
VTDCGTPWIPGIGRRSDCGDAGTRRARGPDGRVPRGALTYRRSDAANVTLDQHARPCTPDVQGVDIGSTPGRSPGRRPAELVNNLTGFGPGPRVGHAPCSCERGNWSPKDSRRRPSWAGPRSARGRADRDLGRRCPRREGPGGPARPPCQPSRAGAVPGRTAGAPGPARLALCPRLDRSDHR